MTYLYQKTQLDKQMNLLIDFLPYCENNTQRFKILDEIQELKYRMQRIDRMFAKYANVDQYTEIINSEMNFENINLRIA